MSERKLIYDYSFPPSSGGGSSYGTITLQGNWDANANNPDITGTTTVGDAWVVSVPGSTNLGGITTWKLNDMAVKTATGWLKIDNQSSTAVWGNITGTLSSQTDLNTALSGKEPTLAKGNLTESTTNSLTISGGTNAVIGSGTTITLPQNIKTTSDVQFNSANLTAGLKDANVATAIHIGDASNTALSTTNKTVVGAINEVHNALPTGSNTGDVTLATNSGLTFTSGQSGLAIGTPTTVSGSSTNSTTTSTHSHAITGFEPTLTKGNLAETTSSVLTITGGSSAVIGSGTTIAVKKASGSQDGYLAQGDFTTFNGKQNALGFTPENVSNKENTTLDTSSTK